MFDFDDLPDISGDEEDDCEDNGVENRSGEQETCSQPVDDDQSDSADALESGLEPASAATAESLRCPEQRREKLAEYLDGDTGCRHIDSKLFLEEEDSETCMPKPDVPAADASPVVAGEAGSDARVSFNVGSEVEIKSLQSRADLNGRRGSIVAHDAEAGRFEVLLHGPTRDERIRCKPANLVLINLRQSVNKTLGDDAFKAGRLEEAIKNYRAALQEDGAAQDDDFAATIRSNLSACFAKGEQHEAAVREADEAIRLRPDWPKGHSRRGFSLLSLGRNEEAQASYIRATQLDPATDGYLAGLRQASERRFAAESASSKAALAEEQKVKGNDAMKCGRLPESIAHYTVALAIVGSASTSATYASNRSAAFAKLRHWNLALADAQETIRLQPNWAKAYLRAGCAYFGKCEAELAYMTYLKAADFSDGYSEATKACQSIVWQLPRLESPLARRRALRFEEDAKKANGFCRVFAISDVHIDHGETVLKWAQNISATEFKNDILLVAGDLGDTFNAVQRGLSLFKRKFRRVFYSPGNHDMWIRPNTQDSTKLKFKDSIQKFLAMLDMCDQIGAEMMPAEVMQDVFVVPLHSWWSCTFDVGDPRPGDQVFDAFCKWPMGEEGAHKFFLQWNDYFVRRISKLQRERGRRGAVITFSHFLPVFDIFTSNAPVKASGCLALEEQVTTVQSQLHIFGHTHMNFSHECRGVMYQQHSLMGPEYGLNPRQPFLKVYDGMIHKNAKSHNVY